MLISSSVDEAADRQSLQALGGGEVDGAIEDRGAGLGALAGRDGLSGSCLAMALTQGQRTEKHERSF